MLPLNVRMRIRLGTNVGHSTESAILDRVSVRGGVLAVPAHAVAVPQLGPPHRSSDKVENFVRRTGMPTSEII
jgi:hypothetical protein